MRQAGRLRRVPSLEMLEDRRLMAIAMTAVPTPVNSYGGGITAGPDGNLWFTASQTSIGRITPAGVVDVFDIGGFGAGPERITAGPDGNLWFTEGGAIGRLTPSGVLTEFTVPTGSLTGSPREITAGPDGNLWYTRETGIGTIGRITPDGVITEFPLGDLSTPHGITAGPDGNLWFTELAPQKIGRITPSGQITEFAVPISPREITAGPDGNLWFGGAGPDIARITPAGVVSITSRPTGPSTAVSDLSPGPDGNVWYTDRSRNVLGRINPAGQIVEIPVSTAGGAPVCITAGPDGNLWFTELAPGAIGKLVISYADVEVSLSVDPVSPTFPEELTLVLTVTNHGSSSASGVIVRQDLSNFMRLVSATASQGTANTILPFSLLGFDYYKNLRADLGQLDAGATATIRYVVRPSNSGSLTFQATVSAFENDPNPSNDTTPPRPITVGNATTPPTAPPAPSAPPVYPFPPLVLVVRSIRTGKKGLTAVVVRFDSPMNSARLAEAGVFRLATVVKGKKARPKPVAIARSGYDPVLHEITLTLKKPFKTGALQLMIDAARTLGANGQNLAGGNYVTIIRR